MVYILATTSGVAGALAVPGGLWHLTFALGWLGNLGNFYIELLCWAPWISQVQSIGLPGIFLRAQPFASVQCRWATDSGIQDSKWVSCDRMQKGVQEFLKSQSILQDKKTPVRAIKRGGN